MKLHDKTLKLVIVAVVAVFIMLFSCIGCGFLGYGYYKMSARNFEELIDSTKELDNYTLSYDFYLRGNSEYRYEDFWIDISGTQMVDDNIWRGSLNLDSHNYQSQSEFADLRKASIGRIDYEDYYLNKSWQVIRNKYDSYYSPYHFDGFQRNENKIMENIISYEIVLNRLLSSSKTEMVTNANILEGKYYIKFDNPDPVIAYFVTSLIEHSYHYVCIDSIDVDAEDIWATVSVDNGIITEIKIYFTDVKIDDCGDEFYIEEGGITYTLKDINKTEVAVPFGFEED